MKSSYNLKDRVPWRLAVGFLVMALIVGPVSECVGQSTEPFKGAKKIVFKCELENAELYKKIGKHLAQNGYVIESSSEDFLTIKTGPRPTSRLNFSYYIQLAIDGDIVIMTIFLKLNSSILAGTRETAYFEWEYAKSRGNVQNVIHEDVLGNFDGFERIETYYL